MTALLVGFGLGFFVGAQPGPVSLPCVRSVLRGAPASGIAIGTGAALVDLLYAALGVVGALVLAVTAHARFGPRFGCGWAARPPRRWPARDGRSPPPPRLRWPALREAASWRVPAC